MLAFNDQPILEGAGSIGHDDMKKIAHERYDAFDQQRRMAEAKAADAADLKELEQLEQSIKQKAKGI